jgi:DNA-binding NarL/FixJ family response regulator
LLLETDGYEVVGEAEDGMSGLRAAHELKPDVVLLDVQLPDIDGFDVAARLTSVEGAPKVVLTSTRDVSELTMLIRRSGARGFVPKTELCGSAIADLLP